MSVICLQEQKFPSLLPPPSSPLPGEEGGGRREEGRGKHLWHR